MTTTTDCTAPSPAPSPPPVEVWRYVIRSLPRTHDGWQGWGIFLLTSDGMLAAYTDYGNYCFKWSDWGNADFRAWVARCDEWYLLSKLAPAKVLLVEESVRAVRDEVRRQRRAGEIDRDQARWEWDHARQIYDDVRDWYEETKLGPDVYGLLCYGADPQASGFYKHVWSRLVPMLLKDTGGAP